MRTKLFTLFLALVTSIGTIFAESGTCGENLTWDLTNGVLTISGTGNMNDYSLDAPWYNLSSSIKSVVILTGVTSIGLQAFSGCIGLTSITIPNSVTSIGSSAFSGCTGLTSIAIPNSVTSIESGTFQNCRSLKSVEIPNSVTSIGIMAFHFCSSLTSVTIPNGVTSVRNAAFSECTSLTSVTIPNSVTSIEGMAFSDCSSLTSVTIPNSVTNIGEYAFGGCTSLTSIEIPNSVTSIGNAAFMDCCSLNSPVYNAHVFAFMPSSYEGAYTIPNGIETIAGSAFAVCTGLTSVTIGNSVTRIGDYAFNGCTGLTSVTIPRSVTNIGEMAFAFCSGLVSIIVELGNTMYDSRNNCNAIIETASNILFSGCQNTIIPSSVTSIGTYAFIGCSSLTSMIIPNSVTSIERYTFAYCYSLSSVTIPNSVTNIGEGAFYLVPNIIYNGTATGSPWGARSINGFVEGWFVYSNNTKTKLLACFAAAAGDISIPNSVTSIGTYAFAGCTGLTSVTIGNSVTSIGGEAFADCTSLTSVTCLANTPPQMGIEEWNGGVVFQDLDCSQIHLYVPTESIDAYKSADQWKNFYPNIFPITADETTGTAVTATPSNNSVILSWPSVANADTYTIEIRKNGELICTLTFNAQGQLLTLNFAMPARDGHPREAQTAIQTANGWQYTVNSLDPATEYTYTVTAKQGSSVLFTQSVEFHTNWLEPIDNVQSGKAQSTKVLRNGQLFILRNGHTYDAKGQEVR